MIVEMKPKIELSHSEATAVEKVRDMLLEVEEQSDRKQLISALEKNFEDYTDTDGECSFRVCIDFLTSLLIAVGWEERG